MSNGPIVNDIAYIDTLVANSQSTFSVLSSNAQKSFDLRDSLLSNTAFAQSVIWVNTFIRGLKDYNQGITPAHTFAYTTGLYYGDNTSYFGNLNNFTVVDSTVPASSPFPSWNVTAGTSYTLSAGPSYYSLNPRVTFTSTTTSVASDTLLFHASRYAFICQYLWANPNNTYNQTRQLSAIPYTTIYNIKNGVYFNGSSLLAAASAMQIDSSFYLNKQTYLSTLV